MYAFGHAYSLTYKMATFITKKGLFNTVIQFTGPGYWRSDWVKNNETRNEQVVNFHKEL